ncbi:hypothetical protein CCACVL1_02389 [Corchorus capsularis]|uniref:Uncharacterized protein n=1 Tax=Corchorus capsularis TaxID=210143 RepID=A0A1R3K8X2_COCAP|nr:hypothetical protein CCACVL1_02389 [Corchorus capsularis]
MGLCNKAYAPALYDSEPSASKEYV